MSKVPTAGLSTLTAALSRGTQGFMSAVTGYGQHGSKGPIDPCENAYEFVNRYQITVDGRRFDWKRYSHMVEVYQDPHPEVTVMAGAQSGKSVLIMANMLRFGVTQWGGLVGYYFPDFFLPKVFSRERFRPLVASSDELAPWLEVETTKGKGSDAVLSRSFGPSTFLFLSVAAKTSTEGNPMFAVFFDEVRRMQPGDVQRAEERTSSFVQPIIWKVSTAYYPGQDIHAAFLAGDQRYYHSDCGCAEGIVLPMHWPDCIVDLAHADKKMQAKVTKAYEDAGIRYLDMDEEEIDRWGEAAYICPKCETIIVDPRDGWWEAHNPEAYAHSYHLSQLMTQPAARVWKKYTDPDKPLDVQEFWNSALGLPWVSAESQYVQLTHLQACVDDSLVWAALYEPEDRQREFTNTAMGIDQMGEFNCVSIKRVHPSGKYEYVHVEVTWGEETWRRCAELMVEYDVRICVADQNPNFNDARKFQRMFPGRVWLVAYQDDGKGRVDIINWRDVQRKKGQRGGKDLKLKHVVTINRTKVLEWSLSRFRDRLNVIPDPTALIQELPKQKGRVMLTPGMGVGEWSPVKLCEEVLFPHLQKMVRRKIVISDDHQRRGDYKIVAEYIGTEDPHFVFANLFADIACSRIGSPRGIRST